MDAGGLARALGISVPTARRHLAAWFRRGIPGVTRERSPGATGWKYLATPDVVTRRLRGKLLAPHAMPPAGEVLRAPGDPQTRPLAA